MSLNTIKKEYTFKWLQYDNALLEITGKDTKKLFINGVRVTGISAGKYAAIGNTLETYIFDIYKLYLGGTIAFNMYKKISRLSTHNIDYKDRYIHVKFMTALSGGGMLFNITATKKLQNIIKGK